VAGLFEWIYSETLTRLRLKRKPPSTQWWPPFKGHVADTINGVTANAELGAQNSASDLTRTYVVCRPSGTPPVEELWNSGNLYDHAWLNGSNEYIMSDNPNFNPNGNSGRLESNCSPYGPRPSTFSYDFSGGQRDIQDEFVSPVAQTDPERRSECISAMPFLKYIGTVLINGRS